MWDPNQLFSQLPFVLEKTSFAELGERYEGKVRDCYQQGAVRYLIATDRLSCFDRVVTSIPCKGQVLTQLAAYWFEKSAGIVQNHIISVPHPNVMVAKECQILPIEVVVRGYLAGSAWRDYQAGRSISGVTLPGGMQFGAQFAEPIITPSTKAARGEHDQPISEREIIERRIVSQDAWEQVREKALALFRLGARELSTRDLLLVDTKYEFGVHGGEIVLADEIHTLDSSRFWVATSYAERRMRREPPEMLDKEPTRQWLLERGFQGEGPIPHFTPEHRVQIACHYISSFERITGVRFEPLLGDVGSALAAWAKRLPLYQKGL